MDTWTDRTKTILHFSTLLTHRVIVAAAAAAVVAVIIIYNNKIIF